MMPADIIKKYPAEIALCAILCLSAFLNLWNIGTGGFSNAYYAAAVKSTLVNPVAGFFNSLDPAGFITVDKPPVGLWVQAAFAAVLGFSGWVLILPQALAGVGSVALIYFIVSRPFGKPAGLVAAFALAVTPISVAIARNGTMDMQMIFVVLLAVWAALKAAREQSLPWLLCAAVLVGVGFNIKMIQAFIVVPAILIVYLLATTDFSWKKRVIHLGLAVLVLLAVSLSWALVVDSIPKDQRPFVGGSDDNTELGLILNYNGAHRLGIGDSSGPGGSSGPLAGGSSGGLSSAGPGGSPGSPGSASAPPGGSSSQGPGQGTGRGNAAGSSGMSSGGPGGMGGGGTDKSSSGLFRLFQNDLAGDIGWLLVFALIGVLAWAKKPRSLSLSGIKEAGYFSERGLTLLAMLLWLVPGLIYFSFTSGFWHDYYIATLAPPLAALVGIGAVGMYQEYVTGSRAGWLLVIAVLATGLVQAYFLGKVTGLAGSLSPFILAATLICAGLLALMMIRTTMVPGIHRGHILAIAIAILLIAPLAWSCTQLPGGNSGNLPSASLSGGSGGSMGGGGPGGSMSGGSSSSGIAGPGNIGSSGSGSSGAGPGNGGMQQGMTGNSTRLSDRQGMDHSGPGTGTSGMPSGGSTTGDRDAGGSFMSSGPGGMGGPGESGSTAALTNYLLAHTTNETWILAVPSSHQGADLIIDTGKPVMCLGGFAGSDQVLNVTTLQEYIHDGKVRFFQTGSESGGTGSGNSAIFSWVSAHCTAVSLSEGTGAAGIAANQSGENGAGTSLYDCLGAA
jgi:4-amino-4-deoxy-L-arabinose transferase-like glycosyltransferase